MEAIIMETTISKISIENQTDFLFKKALLFKFGMELVFLNEKTAMFEISTPEAALILHENIEEFSKTHYYDVQSESIFCKDKQYPFVFCTCPNCRKLSEQSRKFKIGALAPMC